MGPYGPIWARPGPLKSGKSKKKTPLILSNTFFSEIVVFDLQTRFFDGKTVFFRFLAEIRLRTLIKSPQKPSYRPKNVQIPYPLHPALTNSLVLGDTPHSITQWLGFDVRKIKAHTLES